MKNNKFLLLMADDDRDDYFLTCEAAESAGTPCEIRSVQNGQELLEYLRHAEKYSDNGDFPMPDLILLDLNMPLMNGYSALDELRKRPGTKEIPVVVFSTSGDPHDIRECYRLGANSFIQKPADFDTLVHIVSSLVQYWGGVAFLPNRAHNADIQNNRMLEEGRKDHVFRGFRQ